MNLEKILKKIESEKPEIGIGTAAATAGILAASLVIKVASKSGLKEVEKDAYIIKNELKNLIKEDSKAYKEYIKAYKSKDKQKIKEALNYIIETPIGIAEQSYKIILLAEAALKQGKKSMVLEAYGAAKIGRAAVESAAEIADFNLKELKYKKYRIQLEKYVSYIRSQAEEIEKRANAEAYVYKNENT